MKYLHLIRWKNLLLLALAQVLVKYALLEPFLSTTNLSITLNGFGFSLLVISTLSLAAAGYIINDLYDIESDRINKPNRVLVGKLVREKTAYNLFIGFNVVGVGLGFYLSHLIGKSGFFALFVIISGLLYLYATYLKQLTLVGNVVVSILVAFSVIVVGLFELLPAITSENQQTQLTFFSIIFDYAIFAFSINLLREMVKDLEDLEGDVKTGRKTLAVVLGRTKASKVVLVMAVLFLAAVTYYVLNYFYKLQPAVLYFLLLVIGPLALFCIKIYQAKSKTHYKNLSRLLKLIMLMGILSLLLYKYVLLN
ncbi:MAG TPA: geranylgeranylglycerol-phosphate geranylgeranyltransferase [Flavobacteriaceae bacterium]|nr:geranylgeranylglycerol-phosphate geranylgeranyltransferase [Flavobacteriaceae bacterium]